MNNKRYSKIAVLFILALGLNIQDIQAAEQVDLKLILRPNQKYEMRLTSKINSSQTFQGQVSKNVEEEIIEVAFDVQQVNSQGDILIKVTFEKLKTRKKSAASTLGVASTIEFDSTKPNADPSNRLAPIYSTLIGQSFKIKVASNGKILELQSIDDMFLKMTEKVIAAEDEKMDKKAIQKKNQKYGTREKRKEKTKKTIEFYFGEEKMRTMMRAFIQILPSGPVKPGDSWESGIDIWDLQGYEANLKNTLKNYEKDKAIIDSVYKRSLDDKPIKDKRTPNVTMTLTKIDYRGTAQIDKSSGWIIHKEVKTSFSAEMTLFSAKLKDQKITTPFSVNIVKIIEPVESLTSP
ncbi:MAG: DUF6263 family protein [Planctomycetota bacterium]|jgi:hypothetical protein